MNNKEFGKSFRKGVLDKVVKQEGMKVCKEIKNFDDNASKEQMTDNVGIELVATFDEVQFYKDILRWIIGNVYIEIAVTDDGIAIRMDGKTEDFNVNEYIKIKY